MDAGHPEAAFLDRATPWAELRLLPTVTIVFVPLGALLLLTAGFLVWVRRTGPPP